MERGRKEIVNRWNLSQVMGTYVIIMCLGNYKWLDMALV